MSTLYFGLLGLALVIAAAWALFLLAVVTLYQVTLRRERQHTGGAPDLSPSRTSAFAADSTAIAPAEERAAA